MICLEIGRGMLDALEDLLNSKLGTAEYIDFREKVKPLHRALVAAYDDETIAKEMAQLVEENTRVRLQAGNMKYQVQLAKDMRKYAEANFSAVAADLVINPEPVELPCTEKGRSLNFMVGLNNVLAIESEGRIKRIYLKEAIIPKEGGKPYSFIETNNAALGFDKLMRKLQKNRQYLFRVSISYVINIFHYIFSESNVFHIIDKPNSKVYEPILSVETDKKFNLEKYHKQLWEIDYLYIYRSKFAINEQKMDEIARYIDSIDVTK